MTVEKKQHHRQGAEDMDGTRVMVVIAKGDSRRVLATNGERDVLAWLGDERKVIEYVTPSSVQHRAPQPAIAPVTSTTPAPATSFELGLGLVIILGALLAAGFFARWFAGELPSSIPGLLRWPLAVGVAMYFISRGWRRLVAS